MTEIMPGGPKAGCTVPGKAANGLPMEKEGSSMFAPSIKVDFDKLQGEEEIEEPRTAKAKAAPKARAGAKKAAATQSTKDND